MTRAVALAAAVALLLAFAAGSQAKTLSMVRAGSAPAYPVDESVIASDGARWLYLRHDPLSIRAIDAATGQRRTIDLTQLGAIAGDDCRPASATTTRLLVSCTQSGAILLSVPAFTRAAITAPTPVTSWLPGVLPRQWQVLGSQWMTGGQNECLPPTGSCGFYLNYHTGAYHLENGFDTDYRQQFFGTRRLDDPGLDAVPGCGDIGPPSCPTMGRYSLRSKSTDSELGRLELLRHGRRLAVLARHDPVFALGLQADRAAWIAGARVRLYDVRNGRRAVYRLPNIGPTLQPRQVVQTDGRLLVEFDSTAVNERVVFYEAVVPRALREPE